MRKDFTEIYYAKADKIDLEKSLKFLPKIRLEKVNKLQDENAKKLSVAVYLLLRKAFRKHFVKIEKYEFDYMDDGRPIIINSPLQFSLSHSGNYVAVGISNNQVGVDIQEMKEIDFDARKLVFNEEDEKFFQEAENKLDAFYTLWTIKEAAFKFDGLQFKRATIKDAFTMTVEGNYKLAYVSISGNYKIKKIRI